MTAIQDMSASDLLAAYKAKKLSPVEAVDAIIARIEAWEPKLKALYAPDFGEARKQAQASEQRWQQGCRNAAQLWRELREEGFDGLSRTVRDWIRKYWSTRIRLHCFFTSANFSAIDCRIISRLRGTGA